METTWDLSKIYACREDYDKDIGIVKKNLARISKLKEDFKGNFKEILLTLDKTTELVDKLNTFAKMTRDEDSTLALGQDLALETDALVGDYSSTTAFFTPSLLALKEEDLERIIEDEGLALYRKYLMDIYRFKDYTLGEPEEYILGSIRQMSAAPSSAYYMLTNADMEFPKMDSKDGEDLTQANYVNFLKDPDVAVRKEAFDHMYDGFASYENTISTLMNDNVNNLVTEARLRNYGSAIEKELYRDDVGVQVYDNLILSIRENLPSLHEYYRVKKDVLGLEDQHMYDVYLPITGGSQEKISYDQAKDMIMEAMKPLGEDYIANLSKAFSDRWIDVYPRKGKKGGAYSWGTYSSDPYILMNYTDDLNSVFTLAHELGHSMHSYYSRQNPYIYSGYTIFVAEVASTTNELLLLHYLMDKAETKAEKLALVDHYLDSFKSTVFRQTMFAEFEKFTHETIEAGETLTLDKMNDFYLQLNKDYFGDSVVVDEKIKYEWMRIPHFYRNFYVYKYATGFLTAVVLSRKILAGDGVEDYLNFLKDGSNNFPIDQLKNAGADIMDPETFKASFGVFEDLVEDLKKLV